MRRAFLTLLCNPSWIFGVPHNVDLVLTSFSLCAERLGCAGGLG